jgi:hypothetical protein
VKRAKNSFNRDKREKVGMEKRRDSLVDRAVCCSP